MATSLLSSFNERDSELLKQQILSQPNIQKLFTKLDADHVLVGTGVVYITKDLVAVRLREFSQICRVKPIHIVIHEIPPTYKTNVYAKKLTQNTRESKLVGWNCSAYFWRNINNSLSSSLGSHCGQFATVREWSYPNRL